jgi:hypothetical protein
MCLVLVFGMKAGDGLAEEATQWRMTLSASKPEYLFHMSNGAGRQQRYVIPCKTPDPLLLFYRQDSYLMVRSSPLHRNGTGFFPVNQGVCRCNINKIKIMK